MTKLSHSKTFLRASLVALLANLPSTQLSSEETVYRETFSDLGNPAQYLRIARAGEKWEILEENGERFLRVHFKPTESKRQGLVVWDLVPIQFNALSVEIRPNSVAGEVFLQANLSDREGTSYTFRPYGHSPESPNRKSIPVDKWSSYDRAIPTDLSRIFARGQEVAPFLHGRGEEVEAWDDFDFENRGYRTLHLRIDFSRNLIGASEKPIAIDFRRLTLSHR